MVLSSVPNIDIPGKDRPKNSQEYVWNRRLIKREGVSNKEYTVRVYIDENGKYEVWAFNGRTNRTQIPQPKGRYDSRSMAERIAEQVIGDKRSGGYVPVSNYGINEVNSSLPGIPAGTAPRTTGPGRPPGTTNRPVITPQTPPSSTPTPAQPQKVTPELPKKTPEELADKIDKKLKEKIMDIDMDEVLRKMEEQE